MFTSGKIGATPEGVHVCVCACVGARAGGGVGKVQSFLLIVHLILPAFDFI